MSLGLEETTVGAVDTQILVVENDPVDAEFAALLLRENCRANVQIAYNGEDALKSVFSDAGHGPGNISHFPALILLDLKLSKINGLEVLRRLRSDLRTSSIPVIVLTSSTEERDLVESSQLGIHGYLLKPLDFGQFRDTIGRLAMSWLIAEAPSSQHPFAPKEKSVSHQKLQVETPIRALFVEDNPADAELCVAEMKRAGLAPKFEIVQTREQFAAQVRSKTFDIVIADYQIPGWKGTEAILLLQELGIRTPVIVVTGSLGEESTVECLKLGASDLVLKDRLARLPVAVRRALREESARQDALRVRQELARVNQELSEQVLELHRQSDEAAAIRDMSDLLQTCLTGEEAFQVIRQTAERLFPTESGALYMLNAARSLLEPVANWGAFSPGDAAFPTLDCWGLRRGRIQFLGDPPSGLVCKHLGPAPARDSLCAPLMAQGEALGLLHLKGDDGSSLAPNPRRAESRRILAATIAERIALALANLKLRESLRWQSIRDQLTGLFNRRYMEESFDRELRRAVRNQRALGVIMLDVDHFKNFNDTRGHASGDALLTAIGDLLQSRTRREDIACRYGGEEFVLILPEADLTVTQLRAEELREEVKQLRVRYRGKILDKVTLSLGVAAYPKYGDSAGDLIRLADAALYRAKVEGRDRVVLAELPEAPAVKRLASGPQNRRLAGT
jgi:diguanylate cyclase (GGDEF)-like protein